MKPKKQPERVIVIIEGGCAVHAIKPRHIRIVIWDYDVDSGDTDDESKCKRDSDGNLYREIVF